MSNATRTIDDNNYSFIYIGKFDGLKKFYYINHFKCETRLNIYNKMENVKKNES